MTARVGRLLGQVVVWAVVGAAVLLCGLVALPFVIVGGLVTGVVALTRVLRGVDGSSDGGEPDALTPALRDRIDGQLTPAEQIRRLLRDEVADAADLLSCGCSESESGALVACLYCDWRACYEDRLMPHDCPRDEVIRGWQNAPLPPAVAAEMNGAFAAIVNRSLPDLNGVDQQLSRYYLIGDEK